MRLYNINGRLVNKNVAKYIIKWEGKSRSNVQKQTKLFLKPYWQKHIVYEEFPVYGTLLKVDILNATRKIAIEVQGGQHGKYNKFFHKNSVANYIASFKRDNKKYNWLVSNGFEVVEIFEEEVADLSLKFFKDKFGVDLI